MLVSDLIFLVEDPKLSAFMSGVLWLIVTESALPCFPRTVGDSNNKVNLKKFLARLDSDISNLPSVDNM